MPLDREHVVTAALDLLNDVGLDQFTTRKLADRLGVKQPALYWHFRNKRELLDEMAARMQTDDRATSEMTAETWIESLREDMRTFRKALLRYRDGARVHAGTRPNVSMFRSIDSRARAMCDAGFAPADAVRAFKTVSNYVVGAVMEEQSAIYDERGPIEESFATDPGTHPTLSSALEVMRHEDESDSFEFGLDAMIRGFAATILRR